VTVVRESYLCTAMIILIEKKINTCLSEMCQGSGPQDLQLACLNQSIHSSISHQSSCTGICLYRVTDVCNRRDTYISKTVPFGYVKSAIHSCARLNYTLRVLLLLPTIQFLHVCCIVDFGVSFGSYFGDTITACYQSLATVLF
jgi:hypothetical protein